MDFVSRSFQVGFFDGQINEARAAVARKIFFRPLDFGVHAFQNFKLDFKKFDRRAGDFDFGMSDETGGDERHGFDRILRWFVLDVDVDFFHAGDS